MDLLFAFNMPGSAARSQTDYIKLNVNMKHKSYSFVSTTDIESAQS
jgi:hypothetical protein